MEALLTHLADYLWKQSWQIALLVAVVALASWALRNRSAHVRYLLWLLVLAKCLAPPIVQVPLPVLPEQTPAAIAPNAPPAPAHEGMREESVQERPRPTSSSPVPLPQPPTPASPLWGTLQFTTPQWLAVAWLAGVALFLCVALTKATRTILWLRHERRSLPHTARDSFEETFRSLRVKRPPRVWLMADVGQPFVWGFVRGDIYLPQSLAQTRGEEHRRSILAHEIGHVLRLDAAVNSLQIIAQAIFWFHPLVWWANQRIRREREKCCDEMAIAHLGTKPKDYSSAIVETLAARFEATRPVPSLAVAGPVKNLEERIKTMLKPGKTFYKRPSLTVSLLVALAALLTIPTALVLAARAQTEAPKSQGKATPPLHEAALAGDIEKVKSLLTKGTDAHEKDPYGRTALHCASWKGHAEVAELLIRQGARVNVTTAMMASTPLHFAVLGGDKQTIRLLLSKGANPNAKNRDGMTPLFEAMRSAAAGSKEMVELLVAGGAKIPALHLAAYRGDVERLKKCLEEGIDINSQEDFGCTALHAAVNGGKREVVEFLMSKGAAVDARGAYYDLTPLYYAVRHNYRDIADLLLAKGADVNTRDKGRGGFTLLYHAIWDDSKEAVELLLSRGAHVNIKDDDGLPPLFYAIYENDKDIVALLIRAGADVKARDAEGLTPRDWAAREGHKELVALLTPKGAAPPSVSAIHSAVHEGDSEKVKRLIEQGADINAKDEFGETLLSRAISDNQNDIVELLVAKGADVNARANQGALTLLHEACLQSPKDVIELLLAKGADVNARAKGALAGLTPLHVACRRGQTDVVELLIAQGADLNAKITSIPAALVGVLGATPLHLSSMLGHKDVVGVLMAKGADINARKGNNQTPLHEACSTGRKDVVELLIAKGADLNARDSKEQTPLSLAQAQGHQEIAALLRRHGAKE